MDTISQLKDELQYYLHTEYGEQWIVRYQDSEHVLKNGRIAVLFVDAYEEEQVCFILEYDLYKWEIQIPEMFSVDVLQEILDIVKKHEKEYPFVNKLNIEMELN